MRIFSGIALLLIAGCSKPAGAPPGEVAACALDGSATFTDACTLERNGETLVVHRPDGGFRRLVRVGGNWTTDGADLAEPQPDGSVKIGIDRFKLPK